MARRPLTEDEIELLAANLGVFLKQLQRLRVLTERAPTSPRGLYGSSFQPRGCVVDIRLPGNLTLDAVMDKSFIDSPGSIAYSTTALHEIAHWFQYACTPYGMYVARVQEAQTGVVRMLCSAITTSQTAAYQMPALPPGTLPMPFFRWLADNLDLDTQWGMITLSAVRRWLAGEDLVAALEGLDPRLEAGELGTAFFSIEGKTSDEDALLRFPAVKARTRGLALGHGPLQPVVDGEPFGAHRIAECAASLQACGDYDAFDESTLVGDYRPAYGLVRDRFPTAPTGHVVRTVLALSEVAFWSDILPHLRKRTLRRKNVRWQDIHPGWRFVRMVDALGTVGLLRRRADYPAFVRSLTHTLGWTPVDVLAERAILQFSPSDRNPLLNAFGTSCAMRLEDPATFALWFESVVEGVRGGGHPNVLPKLLFWNGERMPGDDSDLLLVAHDMHLIARQFMLGNRFERKHLLIGENDEATFAAFVENTLSLPPDRFVRWKGLRSDR